MLEVNEITDFSEFEGLMGIWNEILQKSGDSDVFSTWEWLWCWWKHFGEKRNLRILVAQEKNEILGIAPLMLSKYRFLRLGKLRKIEFIGSPHSDYNNFILFKNPNKCQRLFLNRLMEFSDWDLLELRDIREGSTSAVTLQRICNNGTSKLKLKVGTLCPYINLPNSLEIFVGRLSRNMRKNLRKRMRKIREKYKVEVKTQRDFDSVKKAMKTFFKLHQKRWRSKRRPGAFASATFRDFHSDLAQIFDKKGWLGLHFLAVNDEPIAAAYSFDYNRKKYGYLTGFDPDFERYGVGNLLKLCVVEYCVENGFREYDLTRDFEHYKADWATGVRKNLVARMVHKGWFARMYDRSVQNSFSELITSKLGAHLTSECIG